MRTATDRIIAEPTVDNAAESWADDIKAHHATYFTAELLQRTSGPLAAEDSVWASDHLALMRMARSMRQDQLARMVYAAQLAIGSVLVGIVRQARSAIEKASDALSGSFARVSDQSARWQRKRRDAFLSESTDIYDLERRMRDLDRRYQRTLG